MPVCILHHEEGQGMVEYGLLIGLIALVTIAALIILGESLNNFFINFGSTISNYI